MNLEELVLPLSVADKAFKTGITAAIAGTTALIGAMGAAIKMTFDWANELDSIGDVMDVTNEQAAAFGFIARKAGVDTGTLTKGIVILSKGLVKADGSLDTTGKALQAWGINVKDVNGNLKSQTTLVDDVAQKYGTFATQQEKVNFLTEVFGRNGAELIDFFDVMASEGGMAAVTEKVKAFGLAIDPARYEDFNRNLAELKLIGTGLAVSFTENLMPSIEKVLPLLGALFGGDWATAKTEFGNLTEELKNQVTTSINGLIDWIDNLDGKDFSDAIVNFLTGGGGTEVNDPNGLTDAFVPSSLGTRLVDAIKNLIKEADWEAIGVAIGAKFDEINWNQVGLSIYNGTSTALKQIGVAVDEMEMGEIELSMGGKFGALVSGLFGYANWGQLSTDFKEGVGITIGEIEKLFLGGNTSIAELMKNNINQMSTDIGIILDTIKNKFISFANDVAAIMSVITGHQFSAFGIPAIAGAGAVRSSGSAGAGSGGRRASGGAVIAGQQYSVGEFYRPEKFTPAVNGRVDPMQPAGTMAGMGDDVFIQRFADVIARSLRSELQKSGRK